MYRKYAAFNKRPRPKDLCASPPSWKVTNSKRADDLYDIAGTSYFTLPAQAIRHEKRDGKRRTDGRQKKTRTTHNNNMHITRRSTATTTSNDVSRANFERNFYWFFLMHVIMHAIKYILLYIYTVITSCTARCCTHNIATRYYRERI
jgi:hypothetical protein